MPLRIRGRRFRPSAWGFALAALAAGAGIALGNWQWNRAAEKRAQDAQRTAALRAPAAPLPTQRVNATDYSNRRVLAVGQFDARRTILLDHRVRKGRIGYEVVTPMRLGAGPLHVLVLRGWLPAAAAGGALPEVRTPAGVQRVAGLALAGLPQWYEGAAGAPQGRLWQNLRIDAAQSALGVELQPVIIEQRSETADGLLREWPRHGFGAQRNEMYALQWYSLAALAVAIWIVLAFRRDDDAAG